jgi:threonine synthase
VILLRCAGCGVEEDARSHYTTYRCVRCGGILEAFANHGPGAALGPSHEQSMWRYRWRLPVGPFAEPVSLGEGLTPLLRAEALDGLLPRSARVWIKDETCNPSGSFKDRLVSVAITRAREVGANIVTCASSGNAAASTAAYAARAGMTAVVFVPEQTPLAKVRQARAYGARVVLVPGDYSRSYRFCDAVARRFEWPNLTTTYLNPYGTAGLAIIGHELFEQLASVGVGTPDLVAAPVGSGPLLYGVDRGWREASEASESRSGQPALLAVQAEGCAPIARAYAAGHGEVEAWSTPATIASGISDPLRGYTEDGTRTLALVRASGGAVVTVNDGEIQAAVEELARRVGVLAEPTGAAALAGILAHAGAGAVRDGADVVVLVTGHAFKDPQHMPRAQEEPVWVANTASSGIDELGQRLMASTVEV